MGRKKRRIEKRRSVDAGVPVVLLRVLKREKRKRKRKRKVWRWIENEKLSTITERFNIQGIKIVISGGGAKRRREEKKSRKENEVKGGHV